jgi:hypothetical protein
LFAQGVKIDGWVVVGDGAMHVPTPGDDTQPSSPTRSTLGKTQVGSLKKVGSGSGAYVVYDIAITTREGTTMKILRRYSSFEELSEGLMTNLAVSISFGFFCSLNKRSRHIIMLISPSYLPRLLAPASVLHSSKNAESSWNSGSLEFFCIQN